jgi:hypothetical protein
MTKRRPAKIVEWAPTQALRLGDVIWIKPRDRRRKAQPHIVTVTFPPLRKLSKKQFAQIKAVLTPR